MTNKQSNNCGPNGCDITESLKDDLIKPIQLVIATFQERWENEKRWKQVGFTFMSLLLIGIGLILGVMNNSINNVAASQRETNATLLKQAEISTETKEKLDAHSREAKLNMQNFSYRLYDLEWKVDMFFKTVPAKVPDDVLIDVGANGCILSFNVAPTTLTITDNATNTTYPQSLVIQSDGTIGSSTKFIEDIRTKSIRAYQMGTVRDVVTSASNAVSVDMATGGFKSHTLTEDTTFGAPTNVTGTPMLIIRIKQATGNAFTYDLNAAFNHNLTLPITVTADKTDVLTFVYNGGTWDLLGYQSDIS